MLQSERMYEAESTKDKNIVPVVSLPKWRRNSSGTPEAECLVFGFSECLIIRPVSQPNIVYMTRKYVALFSVQD